MNNIIKQAIQHNVEHAKSFMTQFLNSPITVEEIKKATQKLKCKKVAGVDGISAEFYKYGCNELLPALVLMFNTIFINGEYPSRWATGIIHPVLKNGDQGVPDNYRKITVMPCIGKLFESIHNNRLSFNKRPRGLETCQQHCKISATGVSENVIYALNCIIMKIKYV